MDTEPTARERRPAERADPPPAGSTELDGRAARPPRRRSLAQTLALRGTRAQLMAGLLCALLGFALVVQVRQNRSEGLANLRQDELVRVLDEVTQRSEQLREQASALRAQRAELVSGSDTQRAIREATQQRAEVQGILAGRLPAEGPGIRLVVREPERRLPAYVLYNILEELRNAGAEAVQLNDVRLTASSYAVDGPDGVVVDGVTLKAPYRWSVIGDPDTLTAALNIPGGALALVRSHTGTSDIQASDLVEVTAVRDVDPLRFATPAPVPAAG